MFRLNLLLAGFLLGGIIAVAAHLVIEFNRDSKSLLNQDSIKPAEPVMIFGAH